MNQRGKAAYDDEIDVSVGQSLQQLTENHHEVSVPPARAPARAPARDRAGESAFRRNRRDWHRSRKIKAHALGPFDGVRAIRHARPYPLNKRGTIPSTRSIASPRGFLAPIHTAGPRLQRDRAGVCGVRDDGTKPTRISERPAGRATVLAASPARPFASETPASECNCRIPQLGTQTKRPVRALAPHRPCSLSPERAGLLSSPCSPTLR